jgi:hypothetical protein
MAPAHITEATKTRLAADAVSAEIVNDASWLVRN